MEPLSPEKVERSRGRERASLGQDIPVVSFPNQVKIIVLQHPQEPDKELGSAVLLVRALEQAELRVGLSWRSLKALAGESAQNGEWGVLYLGAKGKSFLKAVNFVNAKNELLSEEPKLKGVIVLDGTWSQAKALWWRNSWLTRLKRIVLSPQRKSLYGRLRREPRPDALSTIESAALALGVLDPRGPDVQLHLEQAFQKMLAEYQKGRPAKP